MLTAIGGPINMNQWATTQDTNAVSVDPVTLEVIRHGIISITDQIDANITRTAFSPYIYEYKDYAVGIAGADGELIAQCTGGMPVFVADAVGQAVRDGLAVYGRGRLHHGDVILCNHAAVQGQHLNNTVMYTPIFAGPDRATLVGFFAINVHWIDVGGSAIGSISYSATDIHMEGLQLRSIKLWSKGKPIEEVYRIIENNTRFPGELLGDIEAQLGGCLLGRDLIRALADRYGVPTFLSAVKTTLDQCEAGTREQIRMIADGTYQAEAFLDNDGVNDVRIPINVRVIIDGDEMTVDYSEMSDQVEGCINSGFFGGGQTTARVAFKYLIATTEPANEGTFRPLKLILPEGKLLSARPTAAMGLYSFPFPTVIDAIIKALEPVLPDRVTGAHFGRVLVCPLLRQPGRYRCTLQLQRQRTWRLGPPAAPTTARVRSGPWRMATRASFRWSCRNPSIRTGSRNFGYAVIPAAPANSAAGSASRSNTLFSSRASCGPTSTASAVRRGGSMAARQGFPVGS